MTAHGFYLCSKFPKVSRVSRDGCQVLGSKPDLLAALFALTSDRSAAVAKDCYHTFVNLSADMALHQVQHKHRLLPIATHSERGGNTVGRIWCVDGLRDICERSSTAISIKSSS